MANVHTVSVDFLHILEPMGVEARIIQYKRKFALFICINLCLTNRYYHNEKTISYAICCNSNK